MRRCPECGQDLPDDSESCQCGWTSGGAGEASEAGPARDADKPEPDALADEPEEEELVEDEEEDDEEAANGFDTIPEGPTEEIAFEEDRGEGSISEGLGGSSRLLPVVVAIVLVLIIAGIAGLVLLALLAD